MSEEDNSTPGDAPPPPAPNGDERSQPPSAGSSGESRDVAFPIEKFFQQVAEGVVAAQQDLDERSRAYLQNRHPLVPAAVFRIPKVSAEFMLGAESRDGKGINFIVSVSRDRREMMQQKLSFEIVSVPPPIDEMTGARAEPESAAHASTPQADESAQAAAPEPDSTFPLQEVLDALAQVENATDTPENEIIIARLLKNNQEQWLRVKRGNDWIVLYSPEPEADAKRSLLMAAVEHRDGGMVAKVFTTDRRHTDDPRRFQTIVEALAEFAGGVSDDGTA